MFQYQRKGMMMKRRMRRLQQMLQLQVTWLERLLRQFIHQCQFHVEASWMTAKSYLLRLLSSSLDSRSLPHRLRHSRSYSQQQPLIDWSIEPMCWSCYYLISQWVWSAYNGTIRFWLECPLRGTTLVFITGWCHGLLHTRVSLHTPPYLSFNSFSRFLNKVKSLCVCYTFLHNYITSWWSKELLGLNLFWTTFKSLLPFSLESSWLIAHSDDPKLTQHKGSLSRCFLNKRGMLVG